MGAIKKMGGGGEGGCVCMYLEQLICPEIQTSNWAGMEAGLLHDDWTNCLRSVTSFSFFLIVL